MDGGAWYATVHGVAKTRLSAGTELMLFYYFCILTFLLALQVVYLLPLCLPLLKKLFIIFIFLVVVFLTLLISPFNIPCKSHLLMLNSYFLLVCKLFMSPSNLNYSLVPYS